jgi:hypothetical protein
LPAILTEYRGAFPRSNQLTLQAAHLSSQHVAGGCDRVWQGFISSGDPDKFFSDLSKPVTTLKDAILTLETLFGDAILVSSISCFELNQDSSWALLDLPMLYSVAANSGHHHPNYGMDCSCWCVILLDCLHLGFSFITRISHSGICVLVNQQISPGFRFPARNGSLVDLILHDGTSYEFNCY